MFPKGSTSYEFARYAVLTFVPERVLNKIWKEGDNSNSKISCQTIQFE